MYRTLQILLILTILCLTEATVESEWKKFKKNFNKSYDSQKEAELRFKIFKESLNEIEEHNKLYVAGKVTYKKGITKFADLTGVEFTEKFGLDPGPPKIYSSEKETSNKTGDNKKFEYLNWKEKGAVTRVKDQGCCGSCWIFSAIGVLEGYYFRKTNKLISFSEQNMVDCISNTTCSGGWSPLVFRYIARTGKIINKEEDYPYVGVNGECKHDRKKGIKVNFQNAQVITNSESALKEAVTLHGPILISLAANSKWKLYKSGVWYEEECSEYTNHSLLIVGYGTENGHDYWLIKNSFGTDWGEGGYMKFARNKHPNYCGITENGFYLV